MLISKEIVVWQLNTKTTITSAMGSSASKIIQSITKEGFPGNRLARYRPVLLLCNNAIVNIQCNPEPENLWLTKTGLKLLRLRFCLWFLDR